MLAETPDNLTTWLPIVSNLGFAGLVWYLITISFPKLLERTDQSIMKVIQMSDSRADLHQKETREHIKLISDSYRDAAIESKEQLKIIVASYERTITEIKEQGKLTANKHEATVVALSQAHEKHLNLVISHFSKCRHETSTTG